MPPPPDKKPKGRPNKTEDVDRFVLEQIDTVPHLEALLLLWRSRPKAWSIEEAGRSLYIPDEDSRAILEDLKRLGLVALGPSGYVYNPQSGSDLLIEEVEETYRRELVRISRMIHSKPSSAVREFARAFRLKKD